MEAPYADFEGTEVEVAHQALEQLEEDPTVGGGQEVPAGEAAETIAPEPEVAPSPAATVDSTVPSASTPTWPQAECQTPISEDP
jgi:hypothetical protein